MHLLRFDSEPAWIAAVSSLWRDRLRTKPDLRICMPTGTTPAGSYAEMSRSVAAGIAGALLGAIILPGSAAAATPCWKTLLYDWADNGHIDKIYKPICYHQAIAHLPKDIATTSDVDSAKTVGIIGLVLGALGLIVAIVALVTGRKRAAPPTG